MFCTHATVASTELRELYNQGHRLIVKELVEKMEKGQATPDEKRLFIQLMKQNNITAAPLKGTATQAMAQLAAKLRTFGSLEEKAKVVPLLPPASA